MTNRTRVLVVAGALVVGIAILVALISPPVAAQARAAFVRDIDTPALAPFQASVSLDFNEFNGQTRLTTVPAGKRLVIEYVSYYSHSEPTDQMVWACLRLGEYGGYRAFLEVHPPHASVIAGTTLQEGSEPVKLYFDAGQEVWVSVSKSTAAERGFTLTASGYLVTP